ncbi:MAG: bifunctional adenosylcobinamide kinase/adenosylcobinamide-phosphate guanylyltransferase [Rhodobacter sp.]|nr:bifunctional adenosylcobinamide kinase/adenosylcobinamide-phosphate guanylyltransferase [Rhodobacter sp.]
MLPRRTFVLGGARSGKSTFAERLASYYGKSKAYIATAQAFDNEMRLRVEQHQARRGDDWRMIEAPLDVAGALSQVTAGEVVLLDCATLWLSNQMLAGADLASECETLLAALAGCRAAVLMVSNEVGQGIVPENPMARQFRDEQGQLNQRLAEMADLAVLVVAGLPLVLKGRLPDGFA